jgi:aerobic carbon-monoxide dehydrogenase large subunit
VIARRIGIDPLELRRRNTIRNDELPYTLPSEIVYDASITPLETLEQAAQMIDYDGFRKEQAAAREQDRYLGLGISHCVEPSAIAFGYQNSEATIIHVDSGGKVNVSLSSTSIGMSVETTIVQVVAEYLGCDIDDIAFTHGDSATSHFGPGTAGSRSAVLYGNSARLAALDVRQKILAIAAHAMEANVDDLEIENSTVSVRGTPARSMTFTEIGELTYFAPEMLPPDVPHAIETVTRYAAPTYTFSNACHICTVEVDVATGVVTPLRYVVSEDCGKMINPKIVEGQVFGGVIQGLSGMLFENMVYNEDGIPLSSTFVDYLLATAAEVPTIEIGHIESPAPNALEVKGVGEAGAVASPAAVFNAVADALAPLGVELRNGPLGPAQILDLLIAAGS